MSLRKAAKSPYWRDELLDLEQRLLDPSVRSSPHAVVPLLHPDFVEFGSSGRVYTKEMMVQMMLQQAPGVVRIRDFDVREIAPGAALVTGATAGIGREFCERLAARGHDLVLVARDRTRLEAAARELAATYRISAEPLVADLAREEEMVRVAQRVREATLAVLVNNAGFGTTEPLAHADPERQRVDEHEPEDGCVGPVVRGRRRDDATPGRHLLEPVEPPPVGGERTRRDVALAAAGGREQLPLGQRAEKGALRRADGVLEGQVDLLIEDELRLAHAPSS